MSDVVNWGDPRLPERFWDRVIPEPNSGCWLWIGGGSGNRGDYGKLYWAGRLRFAHAVAREVLVGPIPPGLVIDHLCKTPRCCNPAHLEPVTMTENTRRGTALKNSLKTRASKTHCPRGHEYAGDNLKIKGNSRHCRACNKEFDKARRDARRASAPVRRPPVQMYCRHGHIFAADNVGLYRYGDGKSCLVCLVCRRGQLRASRARKALTSDG